MIIKVSTMVISEAATPLKTYRTLIERVCNETEVLIQGLRQIPQLQAPDRARLLLSSYVLAVVGAGDFKGNTHDGRAGLQALQTLIASDEMFTWTLPRRAHYAPNVRIDSRSDGMMSGRLLPGEILEDILLPELHQGLICFAAGNKLAKHRTSPKKTGSDEVAMNWSMLHFPPDSNEWSKLLRKIRRH